MRRPTPFPTRDAYADLLHQSRGLRVDQQQAREAWVARLAPDRRQMLFELEVLLKGVACFSNPRNHPGARGRTPSVSLDFHEPLVLLAQCAQRISQLARMCRGDGEKAFVFRRYLETVLPEDAVRSQLMSEDMLQATPEGSLTVLRQSFSNLAEVAQGMLRLERVPFRLFYSTASLARREVAQNAFFNPLHALEFRPEFDRISSTQVLELIQRVPGEQAQRLVALTFLSIFRMLHYLSLLERIVGGHDGRELAPGRLYLVLSVLRSDARALSSYLRRRAGQLLADAFEHELLAIPVTHLASQYDALLQAGHRLIDVRSAFEAVSANLRLEMRRIFEHDMPAPEVGAQDGPRLRSAVVNCTSTLRPSLQQVVMFLGKSLGASLEEGQVFDDEVAKRQVAERLRQNVWMFAQIVRAFAVKAKYTGTEGGWETSSGLAFVHEFLAYFRAMGYPLLRASDYPRFAAFRSAIQQLETNDSLGPPQLERAVQECESFYVFLMQLIEQIGRREELVGVAFDKRAAARTLRMYLAE